MGNSIKVGGVEINVKTPGDVFKEMVNGTYPIRAMLYGRAGTGKSRMASTFPGCKGVIDTDNGASVYQGNCKTLSIPEDSALDKTGFKPLAWDMAKAALENFAADPDVTCIVIDSFTTLADACMKKVMAEVARTGQPATFVEWSRQMDMLKEILFKAFSSLKSVIGVFHEDMDKDELSGQVWCLPLITGKLSKKMPGFFDEVYHMEPTQAGDKVKYQVRTKATRMYVAKSRLSTLIDLPELMDADFNILTQRIQAKKVN